MVEPIGDDAVAPVALEEDEAGDPIFIPSCSLDVEDSTPIPAKLCGDRSFVAGVGRVRLFPLLPFT